MTSRSCLHLLLLEVYRGFCTRVDTICFLSKTLTLDISTVSCQIIFSLIDYLVGSPNDSGIITQTRLKKPSETNCLFNTQ